MRVCLGRNSPLFQIASVLFSSDIADLKMPDHGIIYLVTYSGADSRANTRKFAARHDFAEAVLNACAKIVCSLMNEAKNLPSPTISPSLFFCQTLD